MSVRIDQELCIGCNLCVPVCPNRAIAEVPEPRTGAPTWVVKASLCSECHSEPTDFYVEQQCMAVCPAWECIVVLEGLVETVPVLKTRGAILADYRASVGLPRNFAYNVNSNLEPAPGEFGPAPVGWEG